MPNKYLTPSAVMPLILRTRDGAMEILLHRRQNTGYGDGLWDCAGSGHVDADESMTAAVVREAMEELGIAVRPEDVRFATMLYSHNRMDLTTYVDVFFLVEAYQGTPMILEPEKSAALVWFPLDALPEDLLADRRQAIGNWRAGIPFAERGWS